MHGLNVASHVRPMRQSTRHLVGAYKDTQEVWTVDAWVMRARKRSNESEPDTHATLTLTATHGFGRDGAVEVEAFAVGGATVSPVRGQRQTRQLRE